MEIEVGKMYESSTGTVILATSEGVERRFCGVVVKQGNTKALQIGDYSDSFSKFSVGLKEYDGDLTLNNKDVNRYVRKLSMK